MYNLVTKMYNLYLWETICTLEVQRCAPFPPSVC